MTPVTRGVFGILTQQLDRAGLPRLVGAQGHNCGARRRQHTIKLTLAGRRAGRGFQIGE